MSIQENYYQVMARITKAASSAGRDPREIRLVVVTKMQPVENIKSVISAGATDFGENYVEDAIPKIHAIRENGLIKWHMIGHVQSRKSSFVCDNFDYLHSLDSVKLAQRLSKRLVQMGKTLPAWLEFNVSGELTKGGWDISKEDQWESILPDVEQILNLPGINVIGAMTVPPYSSGTDETRSFYRRLRKFQQFVINHFKIDNFTELSIGMTADFEIAIQEGSTCVRIGQAIFGKRVYPL
jgi:pyridoxal phosphate enzyme (YggS family)